MHVRVRVFGKPDTIVVVDSKLTKIEQFRKIIKQKFGVSPSLQRLFYGGKLLENGYTFHDYNIKLNDVIQLMIKLEPVEVDQRTSKHKEEKNAKGELNQKDVSYKDAASTLYVIGDLIDVRDSESGFWLEGKIERIVLNPSAEIENVASSNVLKIDSLDQNDDKENDMGSSSGRAYNESTKVKQNCIAMYLTRTAKTKKQTTKENRKTEIYKVAEENLLFKVKLDSDGEEDLYCKLKNIRPRARREIAIKDLTVGQTVMINHNTENPLEKGDWYDFKIDKVVKLRNHHELLGTLYLGQDAIQNDTAVRVLDKIFLIEDVVPLEKRTVEYKKIISTVPDKRSHPLNCMTCRDDFDFPCKDCGCYLCSGKEEPENILLCDECNYGFHMKCLLPPVTRVPEEDWYCPSCKRDPNDVIAPGAAKQAKKKSASKSNRDWGRGMACVGKTKTCAMPPNHFGPIPGIEVGMCWRFRIQLSESGIHRPPVSGIHGRDVEGAYSIVLSGGYEDDVDHGNEFTYTGSGGRDLSGNKRTAEQSCDQTLTRENKALARNCAVTLDESGADAGDNWKQGKPVRVVRSYKMLKHFPQYAPKEGIRYDGIYKVVRYYPEEGLSGYRVWKYLLRRDDPSPAPWERGAKQYSIVYPDGYLEAEAEKKALKEKNNSKGGKGNKRKALQESNQSMDTKDSPPVKKRKTESAKEGEGSKHNKTSLNPLVSMLKGKQAKRDKGKEKAKGAVFAERADTVLSAEEIGYVRADIANCKLWEDCLDVRAKKTKQEFIEYVTQVFLCIICQDVAVNPVTTPCSHNFCLVCIKLAFKSMESHRCPYCRHPLCKGDLQVNENLRTALRAILAGYDAGKK